MRPTPASTPTVACSTSAFRTAPRRRSPSLRRGGGPAAIPPGRRGPTETCSAVSVACKQSDTDAANGCIHTRTFDFYVSDACKNTNHCQEVFTWTTDTTPPQITFCPAGGDLGCNPAEATLPTCVSESAKVTATDPCSAVTVACKQSDGDSANGCIHTRTFDF